MKKISITIIIIAVAIALGTTCWTLYHYTGKVKKLTCQSNNSYLSNQGNIIISYQRNNPIKLENWVVYVADTEEEIQELEVLTKESTRMQNYRKSKEKVLYADVKSATNVLTVHTIIDTRFTSDAQLKDIDEFYQKIFEEGRTLSAVQKYLEKNNYVCVEE